MRKKRRYRSPLLNDLEAELILVKEKLRNDVEDANMWRRKSGFKPKFSTHKIWSLLRTSTGCCSWSRGIWFPQATFMFVAWLAVRDRLSTMDRIAQWRHEVDETCVLCKRAPETRSLLFFECCYSSQVWEHLTKGIL